MKMFPHTLAVVSTLISSFICGCAPMQRTPVAQTVPIKCLVPKIAALPETRESQDKGGLAIAIAPSIYKTVTEGRTHIEEVSAGAGLLLLVGQDVKNKVHVQETITPYLRTDPKRLEFTVRINNKLDRVFRGQGSVVQFNVGGKLVPFGETDYKGFIDGIVPPRNEAEVKIYGPQLASFGNGLPPKGTIGIFLYDVVTKTDVAGNTTEKQNYEWYFSYEMQEIQQTGEVKSKKYLMDIGQYNQIRARQQASPAIQVSQTH